MKNKRIRQPKTIKYFDYSLLAVLIFLICFGLVMLYSSSSYSALIENGDSMYYLKRQLLFTGVGFVGIWFIVTQVDYHLWALFSKPIYYVAFFLMLLVQTPLGKEVNGARRWIRITESFQLQPSEIAKIAVIVFIPYLICEMGAKIKTFEGVRSVLVWGGIQAAGVFVLTENLSTAIIVMGIACILLFVAHPKWKPFMIILILGIAAIAALRIGLTFLPESSDNFRLQRLLVWVNPEDYASGDGFQTMQGLYAIGAGGFFGKGLGSSAQKIMIPEAQNDWILAIICEELGVFGAIVILTLFGILLYRLLFIAQNAPDLYGSLLVTGIFAHIALQVALNVAVVCNAFPPTGITLPFISYGGTSGVFLMAEMGIALSVSSKIKFED